LPGSPTRTATESNFGSRQKKRRSDPLPPFRRKLRKRQNVLLHFSHF
jgi:hypothetical protein